MKYKNIREITKKEKVRGLTKTSWNLAMFGSMSFFPYLAFASVLLFAFFLILFYIAEYFDDDFIEILLTKIQIKVKNEYFA
ncbi:hypothetical protein CPU12_01260 [Malaciobacter molluscorum LMG 25693]|uniref:P-type type IV conjugative transfer system protein TrbD/VirB3 n=1 Tax=Malaciobacter molluscorum LMG 25693 TaxID=870501 RepID=A0A2G1DM65_9BACT|nr:MULTISPECIES: hypothetical protein [Arcobacteraceae]AXX92208.1 P-type type IV conjugative transfer system protein TrbD/VirB3 [Malaciobacter molluscorum LMG 25693]PHO19436.1 hypothetical protein CPU12_01260 [Malaciobacter molluscorum LMG 25693]RXK00452.1 hypothetical protein CRU98_04650 [Arcobacter sp. CECT 8986]